MRSGVFNETFDTVLYKQGDREQRLCRFATELVYCLLHDESIRLAEPHGFDQALIIRLFELARAEPKVQDIMEYFLIAQKPLFSGSQYNGSAFFPFSVAHNILNPKYDCSSLSPDVEQHRRLLTAEWERTNGHPSTRKDDDVIGDGQRLVDELKKTAQPGSHDDEAVLEYWRRLLFEARKVGQSPAKERLEQWNKSYRTHWFPQLCEPNPTVLPNPMGVVVEKVLGDQLAERSSLQAVYDQVEERTKDMEIPTNLSRLAHYFNRRSHFYVDSEAWMEDLDAEDFQFVKESLDTAYNVVVAHSCNAQHNLFLPNDANSLACTQAQRSVMSVCRDSISVQSLGLVFDKKLDLRWDSFQGLVRSLTEATTDKNFLAARGDYVREQGASPRYEKLKRLADEVNRVFERRGDQLVVMVLDDHAMTLKVRGVADMVTYPRVGENTQGETGNNPHVVPT